MSGVRILIDGLGDVAPITVWNQTQLLTAAQGEASLSSILLRDLGPDPTEVITGKRVTVDLGPGTQKLYGGYVWKAAKRFWFAVDDPDRIQRQWALTLVDNNILFNKRVVFNKSNPPNPTGPMYGNRNDCKSPSLTVWDDDVIDELVTNWLDLSSDGIDTSSRVQRVANIYYGQPTYPFNGGEYWGEAMTAIAQIPAAIFCLDPDWKLVYQDVDDETAPFGLSDRPEGSHGLAPVWEDHFDRVVARGLGNGYTWSDDDSRSADETTENVHVDGSAAILPASPQLPLTGTNYESFRGFPRPASGIVQFDFWVPSLAGQATYHPTYGVNVDDVSVPVFIYVWPLDGSGNWAIGPSAWNESTNVPDGTFSPTASSWYTAQMRYDAEQNVEMRVWKRGDPLPAEPMTSGRMNDVAAPASAGTPWLDFYYNAIGEDAKFTNFIIWEYPDSVVGLPPASALGPDIGTKGYRECTIWRDGTALANDCFGWGAGKGVDHMVFQRFRDTGSIGDHGLWQESTTQYDVWCQGTMDRIVLSMLDGSPSSKRGHKDDVLSVDLVTYEDGFRVGQGVHFRNHEYGVEDVIPIRKMEITFDGPGTPRYKMKLSHLLDTWGFADPQPPFPKSKTPHSKTPPTRRHVDVPCDCGITDTFTRDISNGWGTADCGLAWETQGSYGAVSLLRVTGGKGVMEVSSPEGYYDVYQNVNFDYPLTKIDVKLTLQANHDLSPGSPDSGSSQEYINLGLSNFYIEMGRDSGYGDEPYILLGEWPNDFVVHHSVDYTSPFRVHVFQADPSADVKITIWQTGSEPAPQLSVPMDSYLENGIFDRLYIGAAQQDLPGASEHFIVSVDDFDIDGIDRCGEIQFESFNDRVIDGGPWGPAVPSSEYLWQATYSDPIQLWLGVGYGYLGFIDSASPVGVESYIEQSGPWEDDFDFVMRFTWDNLPVGTPTWLDERRVGGQWPANLSFHPSATAGIGYIQLVGWSGLGPVTQVPFDFHPFTGYSHGSWYLLRWRHHRHSENKDYVKVWREWDPEPVDWTLTKTDWNDGTTDPRFGIAHQAVTSHVLLPGAPHTPTLIMDYMDFTDYPGKPCYSDCATVTFDSFTRTVAGALGTATVGTPWHEDFVGGTDFGVDGSALWTNEVIGFYNDYDAPLLAGHYIETIRVKNTGWPTFISGPTRWNLGYRATNDVDWLSWVEVTLSYSSFGDMNHESVRISHDGDSDYFTLAACGLTSNWQLDTWYNLKLDTAAGTFKIWADGDPEPVGVTLSSPWLTHDSGRYYLAMQSPVGNAYVDSISFSLCAPVLPVSIEPPLTGHFCETVSGTGPTYTLSRPYVETSTEVYAGGLLLTRGVDYTEFSPVDGKIAFDSVRERTIDVCYTIP